MAGATFLNRLARGLAWASRWLTALGEGSCVARSQGPRSVGGQRR